MGLGSAFEASADRNAETTEAVIIEGKEAVPVAFAPAYIIKSTKLANGSTRYEVASVDPDQIEVAMALAKTRQDQSLAVVEAKMRGFLAKFAKGCEGMKSECGQKPIYNIITLDQDDWKFKLAAKANDEIGEGASSKYDVYRRLLTGG